jgi:glycine cleavage system pyridoxal-binding protein P|tara:strand:+ start:3303 stop:3680 length:378 start_codon:yes stop_codon:yes gene_type:complete
MEMTPEFFADYGSIGVFLSFMIYQFLQQKAEIKNITQAFFEQTNKMEEKYEHKMMDLRNRYDQVIKDYKVDLEKAQEERKNLRTNLSKLVMESIAEQKNVKSVIDEWLQEKKLIQMARKLEKDNL